MTGLRNKTSNQLKFMKIWVSPEYELHWRNPHVDAIARTPHPRIMQGWRSLAIHKIWKGPPWKTPVQALGPGHPGLFSLQTLQALERERAPLLRSNPHATVRSESQGLSTARSTPDYWHEWGSWPATQSFSNVRLCSPYRVLLTTCFGTVQNAF